MKNDYEYREIVMQLPDNDSPVVEGKAICFGEPTVLYTDRFGTEYREVIAPDALADVDLSDVPLKYNHSNEKAAILARVRNKSLQLDLRDDGLYFRAELKTNLGADVYAAIKAGDVSKCSFAFICDREEFDQETNTRTIKHIKHLGDISIVDYPAYDQTTVEAREANIPDFVKKLEEAKEQEQRKKLLLMTMTY